MKELPQRRLAYDLRIAIDRCMRQPRERRYRERLDQLIEANPRGVWSSHVQHNLGVARRAWLRQRVPAPVGRVDATASRSLSASSGERNDGPQEQEALGTR